MRDIKLIEKDDLEELIDTCGLAEVLDTIERICNDKSESFLPGEDEDVASAYNLCAIKVGHAYRVAINNGL